jgi:hypothetical protein
MTAYLCAALVGLVFLGTGIIKALDTRAFHAQIREYEILSTGMAWRAAIVLAALECFIGSALLLAVSSQAAPAAIVLVCCLSGVTIWGAYSGHAANCGCYGGVMMLTPRQSVLINCVYIALLSASYWLRGPVAASAWQWKTTVVILVGLAAGVTSFCSLYYGALLEMTLLKAGNRWQKKWLPEGVTDMTTGTWFAVFLSQDCPHCKAWIPFLNILEVQQQSPGVVGIMAMSGNEREQFVKHHMIRFPIHTVPSRLVSQFADAFPTAALIQDGVIRSRFIGELPPEYVQQCREFYQSINLRSQRAVQGFAG